MIEGGCNCGQVRYRIDGSPMAVAQCHCRNCQRQSGSAFSVNLLVKASDVTCEGELADYEDSDTTSGNPVHRRFCPRCGSPIFSQQDPAVLIVKAGTLDEPGAFVPTLAIWTATALPWVELAEGLHTFERNP